MKKIFLGLVIAAVFVLYLEFQQGSFPSLNKPISPQVIVPTPTAPSSSGNPPPVTNQSNPSSGQYKDGIYVGQVADAYYGNVQVQATVQGGKITNVQFLDYPHDRNTSQRINSQAVPALQSEAIQAQSANVDIVSGATATSQAFQQSLATALSQAANGS
ncbi:MAG TPA: FMN-binding protein [Patescibacteria group bacterium]|nr:FMN-binding protein [Patescibacteria group bacterium]